MFKSMFDKAAKWAKDCPVHAALAGAALLIGGLYLIGGYIVVTGLIMGLLLSLAFGILLWKVRCCEHPVVKKIYAQIVAHPILSDIGLTLLGFMACPPGVMAYVAASVTGVLTSVWLLVEHDLAKKEMKEAEICSLPA